MAIKTLIPAQLADNARVYPIDKHGKLRFVFATFVNDAVAGDDGSMFKIAVLPFGRKRIVPWLSRYQCSAFGSSRVLKVGHRAYYDRSEPSASAQAEDDDAFFSGLDISAAAHGFWPTAAAGLFKFDMFSREPIELFGTVTGGTVPANATLNVAVAYIYE